MSKQELRRQWLANRQKSIGASDMPSILGVGYRSPWDVWRSKVEPITDADVMPTGRLLRGLELEPIVAAKYTEIMGVELRECEPITHPAQPYMTASPDRITVDGSRYVQLKTCETWDHSDETKRWGESGTDQIPLAYRVQVNHEMFVSGHNLIDVCCLNVNEWEARAYRLAANPLLHLHIYEAGLTFWQHVESKTPLPDTWLEVWGINQPKPIIPDTSTQLPDEVAALADKRAEYIDIKKQAEYEIDRLTKAITDAIGTHEKASAGEWDFIRSRVDGGEVAFTRQPYFKLTAKKRKAK